MDVSERLSDLGSKELIVMSGFAQKQKSPERSRLRPESRSAVTIPTRPVRYCAISIDVVASLDEDFVKARIRTDTGKNIIMFCEGTRVPAIRRCIERLQHAFPELTAMMPMAASAASPGNGPPHDDR